MKGWSATGLATLALGISAEALAQKPAPVPQTFELKGVLADAKGPLANKVVRVGPVDAQGNVLNIRSLSPGTSGQGVNPQATTDAQGGFTLSVSRSLFRGYGDDQVGLSAYTDLGKGRMSTAHESAVVRIDPKKDKVDAGRVVLAPLKPRGAAR